MLPFGSPPQVRGKPNDETSISAHTGITPAGAGKTGVLLPHVVAAEDHPRRCGENSVTRMPALTCKGSPPQVRGKRNGLPRDTLPAGITPAGAGKTSRLTYCGECEQDHPRRCGENPAPRWAIQTRLGSPPQVRGKLFDAFRGIFGAGITPAGAGKTAPTESTRRNAWDHPRRCGENYREC